VKLKLYIFLIFLPLLFSCSRNRFYEEYRPVTENVWNHDELHYFYPYFSEVRKPYHFYLSIRHTTNYPYSNIWVRVFEITPQADTTSKRYELTLAEPDGRWRGNVLGEIVDQTFVLQAEKIIYLPGGYQYIVQQDMRENEIPEVLAIGLRFDQLQKQVRR
jgi:gliding motility-associated lipoprotein GldH